MRTVYGGSRVNRRRARKTEEREMCAGRTLAEVLFKHSQETCFFFFVVVVDVGDSGEVARVHAFDPARNGYTYANR